MYGRNADLAAERDAILSLPPDQQQAALMAMSQRRSSVPAMPGGFREPTADSEGGAYTEGLPPASGVFADVSKAFQPRNMANMAALSGGVSEKRGEDTAAGGASSSSNPLSGLPAGMQSILSQQRELNRRAGENAAGIAGVEQRQRERIAEGERDSSRAYADTQRQLTQDFERRQRPIPEFIPTQETARDIGTLASLLMVAGATLGGKARGGALMAVQSMTGMMNGYRQGRQDLYQRERQNFETGVRQVQAQNQQLQEAFSRAQRLAQTDMEAAQRNFRLDAVRLGANLPRLAGERAGLQGELQVLQSTAQMVSQIEQRKEAERVRLENATPLVVPGEREGTFVYVRRDGTPILNPQGQPLQAPPPRGAGGTGSNAVQFRYNAAISDAAVSAATDIQNLMSLPATAAPPVLRDYITDPSKGIPRQLTAFMGQSFTSTEDRAMQQALAGLTRSITNIQAAGRPGGVTRASLDDFARTAPQPGDSRINYYLFFAMIRQEMDLAVTSIRNGGGTEEQLKNAMEARDRVYAAIPYSVADVTRIIANGRARISDPRTDQLLQRSNRLDQAENRIREIANSPEEAAANEAEAVEIIVRGRRPTRSNTTTPAPTGGGTTAPVPTGGAPAPSSNANPPDGTTATNSQTGQRMIRRNGRWEAAE
jgi:hypothetical protein